MPVEGMEAFAPVLAGEMDLLLDHLPPRAAVFVCDPERIRSRADELVRTSQEFLEASWINAAAGGEAPIDLGAAAFRSLEEVRDHARELGQPWWSIAPFGGDDLGDALILDAQEAEAYRGDTQRALGDIKDWLTGGRSSRCSARATARPSAWSSCSRASTCPRASRRASTRRPTRRSCTSPPAWSSTASSARPWPS
nr:hypothetical protein GCM10020093_062730 [Planobispora longispora]